MITLGINLSHNASIALCDSGIITHFYDEERFQRISKNWSPLNQLPEHGTINSLDQVAYSQHLSRVKYKSLLKIKEKINLAVYTAVKSPFLKEDFKHKFVVDSIQEQIKNPEYILDFKKHHIYHALSGFYFSKFNDAVALVIDGMGNTPFYSNKIHKNGEWKETESIFYINKNNKIINSLYVNITDVWPITKYNFVDKNPKEKFNIDFEIKDKQSYSEIINGTEVNFSKKLNAGLCFATLSNIHLNDFLGAGKLMGLASYPLNTKGLENLSEANEQGKKAQQYLLETQINLVEKAKSYKLTNNIVLSGGCALNCVNNFKLVKMYPELNFFVDPIPHDGGTAVGAAIYHHDYNR